ncbi:MAG TPA: SRPBCC family protein [Steroidobacteraceae bacterium]|jgi:uncharacterized protein YndB with AHSA1/START domain
MSSSTDRIERTIVLKASPIRVWRALSNAEEFGNWFGVNLKGKSMRVGDELEGHITHPKYEHLIWRVVIERMEPNRLLAWRWHPAAVNVDVDYSSEPTTLVVFKLEEIDGGTRLTVIESGFDAIPEHRRMDAFRMNSGGWSIQMENIEKHVASG